LAKNGGPLGGVFNRSDQFSQIGTERCWVAPVSFFNNDSLWVKDKFSVSRGMQSDFELVIHRVADPWDGRICSAFYFSHMHQFFFNGIGSNDSIGFRMLDVRVDVIKVHVLAVVVCEHCLRTGDVFKIRRSC